MSYVTWKLSGLPPHKVIGAGTYLETTRFRRGIADRMNVHPSCCRAFVIGEHGPKSSTYFIRIAKYLITDRIEMHGMYTIQNER